MNRWWPESITTEPVYADDHVVLFYCDAREIMLALPDNSVDHTICDPPYEEASHTYGKLRDSKGRIALSKLSFVKIEESLGREFTSRHLGRITKGWGLAFCETEAVGGWKQAMEKWGSLWSRAQWWEKPDGSPQMTGHKPGVPGESIATVWCSPGTKSTWNGGGLRGFYSVPVREREPRLHETQKPVALMVKLIELFTNRGEVIFDPFAGAGTTGKAAKLRGRRCIMVERGPYDTKALNDAFIGRVVSRLRTAAEQGLLFNEDVMIGASPAPEEPKRKPRTLVIEVDGQAVTKKKRPRALV